MSSPTIAIITGAWQNPDTYEPLRDALAARGFETVCRAPPSSTLPHGDTDLEADIAFVRNQVLTPLLDAGKDVVLLSHSLGGLIAGNAVQGRDVAARQKAGKKGGVVQLIYLAAFMTPAGASLKDLMGGSYFPWMEVAVSQARAVYGDQ